MQSIKVSSDFPGHILVKMSNEEVGLDIECAKQLIEELQAAIHESNGHKVRSCNRDVITVTRQRLGKHGVINASIQSVGTSWSCVRNATDEFRKQLDRLNDQLDDLESKEN